MSVRVGIIGFGRIGHLHAQWIAQARGIEVDAVFDPTKARREVARSHGFVAVESLADIYGSDSINAVLISTPNSMHFDDAFLALMNRMHVMVEKPFALTLHQATQLVAAAEKTGKILSVFHNRRFDVDYLTVKSAIERGAFGRVLNVESRLGQWQSCVGPAAKEWRPNWRNESAYGGGGLYDWGSHFIDQLWRLMLPAKPQAVFAQLRGNVWTSDRDCDDFARVCINFDRGAIGLVEINTTTTRPLPRWHVDGERGSADSPFSLAFDTTEWAKISFSPADGGEAQLLPQASGGLSQVQIWEHFAAACRGEAQPAVTAQSVLPTMALLDAARESSRSGHAISIDWTFENEEAHR